VYVRFHTKSFYVMDDLVGIWVSISTSFICIDLTLQNYLVTLQGQCWIIISIGRKTHLLYQIIFEFTFFIICVIFHDGLVRIYIGWLLIWTCNIMGRWTCTFRPLWPRRACI